MAKDTDQSDNTPRKHQEMLISMITPPGPALDTEQVRNTDIVVTKRRETTMTRYPVVLIAFGKFNPTHRRHIEMMTAAKYFLDQRGYSVVGGYMAMRD